MGAIGLNPIRLDRIGLDPIRINAIKLGVPGAASDRPYIDPEVLASLKAVCICYGKSNDDPDRAVVKNLVDPDNPFVISNAAFKLNSGFGKYEVDFNSLDRTDQSVLTTDYKFIKISKIKQESDGNVVYSWGKSLPAIDSVKIRVRGLDEVGARLTFTYLDDSDQYVRKTYYSDGTYDLPSSSAHEGVFATNFRFAIFGYKGDCNITIEQIPSFEGAFVTDGVNDMITSTKTVQEMLGGSNEITVVSLITHISGTGKYNIIGDGGIQVSDYSGQTFMAGTSSSGEKIVELGDKEKLQAVQYTTFDSKLTIGLEDSSYAYYGTFVFNKENVPVDWIHQVIAYFNLDRTLKPDILCDVKKQGITNENHAEFGDKLIDFSGNGRDIQLNNLAWDGDSGIGKYNYPNWKVTATIANTYSTIVNYPTVNGTYSINVNGVSELMQSIGLHLEIKYTTSTGIIYNDIKQDGVYSYILPDGATDLTLRFGGIPGIVNEPCNITITQIPSHAGALCLDGVNDFGKVTGMPVYKDYTVVTDREIFANIGAILSKNNPGAFVETAGNSVYSFGQATSGLKFISTRSISYLSKYSYCGQSIAAGAAEDVPDMWLGTIRDGDSRFFNGAIYSLMSFPYSMSEFLIERQLKKHKLGTLYPDMVEFRPIVKSNLPYSSITYSVNPGEYISVDSMVTITVTLPNTSDKLMEVSCNAIS
ncbi:MAG: hypothetical protein E6834_21695, partial [Bacteroides ovatus]|nr:hypothetical protein [Bacteroides ovatus]